ncbi:MAG: excinuclease ABC subunit UvrC [Ferruginibacter sp.]|nr:excinuclease ABC subunit C [Bacteroidota bacterium]MBX2919000.1 excinuclease ABC subunit UvrC [Ferruginibacter sp.]MCB0707894.1 excinuclease ABC subunit C [Chitinophagaceae bacterium]
MTQKEFSAIAHTIPTQPGIYKYFDQANELLYVGKAKHLRKRVSSYFSKTLTNFKTHELVHRIHHIEFTIVNNEQDAFLLENTLIKEFQPRFNISLKDDKTYPYIVIKNEPFPRVFFTRRKINDGSQYLGPYTSVEKVRELLEVIKRNIHLRNCKLNLTENNIKKGKFKVCLEYHLGNCKGPCEGLQTPEDYNEELSQLVNLLKGNLRPVIQYFKKEMKACVAAMKFEEAAHYKTKIEHLKNYQVRSAVVNTRMGSVDVFSILEEGNMAYVNYLAVNAGTIVQTKTIMLEKKMEETAPEVLAFAIAQLRDSFNSKTSEIIVPFTIDYPQEAIKITVPKAGDKKKLLELSLKNVNYFRNDLKKRKMLNLEEKSAKEKTDVLKQLQKDLQLSSLPLHIECFDNSNLHGSYPVSAMVCFINGQPNRKEYRRYKVKTVVGINDFASMEEVVYRRYKRLTEEKTPLPQLVIIDGGKGQLSAAMKSIIALKLQSSITVIGLAKNEEEIFFTGDTQSVKLPWDSESLKLIRRIRDEVHKHGITYHRNLRSKGTFVNEIEQIKGIGKTTANLLLKKFKSVKNIKSKTAEELETVIDKSKAALVFNYFKGH